MTIKSWVSLPVVSLSIG